MPSSQVRCGRGIGSPNSNVCRNHIRAETARLRISEKPEPVRNADPGVKLDNPAAGITRRRPLGQLRSKREGLRYHRRIVNPFSGPRCSAIDKFQIAVTSSLQRGAIYRVGPETRYRQIDQIRSLVERYVVARWHYDELTIWQTSKYLGIFFDGGEVVVAGHDEYRKNQGGILSATSRRWPANC